MGICSSHVDGDVRNSNIMKLESDEKVLGLVFEELKVLLPRIAQFFEHAKHLNKRAVLGVDEKASGAELDEALIRATGSALDASQACAEVHCDAAYIVQHLNKLAGFCIRFGASEDDVTVQGVMSVGYMELLSVKRIGQQCRQRQALEVLQRFMGVFQGVANEALSLENKNHIFQRFLQAEKELGPLRDYQEMMAKHMHKMTATGCGGTSNKSADQGYQHIHHIYKQRLDALRVTAEEFHNAVKESMAEIERVSEKGCAFLEDFTEGSKEGRHHAHHEHQVHHGHGDRSSSGHSLRHDAVRLQIDRNCASTASDSI